MIVGRFGGTLAIVIAFSVTPNNPTIPWSVTLGPGDHSFSKWAIRLMQSNCKSRKRIREFRFDRAGFYYEKEVEKQDVRERDCDMRAY